MEIAEDASMEVEPLSTCLSAVDESRQSGFGKYSPTIQEPDSRKRAEPHRTVFRPIRRPSMAVVRIIDDGDEVTGEEFRVRGDRLVIGRTEGDVVIPHDNAISSRHLELRRQLTDGQYRWLVNDLGTTNGTFARVDEVVLRHNQELIFGSSHYRFDAAPQGVRRAAAPGGSGRKVTLAWQPNPHPNDDDLQPALVELASHQDGARRVLPSDDVVIGSDPTLCGLVLTDDGLIGPREAQLHKDRRGRWMLKTLNSANGVWARVHRIEVVASGQFQIGEQRITIRIP